MERSDEVAHPSYPQLLRIPSIDNSHKEPYPWVSGNQRATQLCFSHDVDSQGQSLRNNEGLSSAW